MPAALAGPLDRARAALATMTAAQKATLVGLVLVLVLGGFFFVRWVTAPTYEPLFTNLSATDASAITDELTAEGVDYQLQGAGTILVPKDRVYALRLSVAGKGLTPQEGSDSGYSLLDEQGITTSEFEQQTTYQRALEGELNNTLEAMDGVRTASVHIAMPKDEVFVTDESRPTAAVLLALTPGTSLAGEQVQAVVNLVSSSIQGMDPADVTVSDTTGRVLSAAGGGASTDSQADATATFQQTLQANAQAMLDRVLGPNNSMVTVAATMNFDQSNSTSTTYSYPAEIPALAEASTTEQYTGTGGAGAAGVLGTDGTATTAGGGDGSYTKEDTTSNNAVNTEVRTTIAAPGQVERLTVAVVLNSADGAATIAPGTVQDLVGNAVSLDPARGDAITVASAAFDTGAADAATADIAAQQAAEASAQMWSLVKTGAIVGGLLLLVLLVWLKNRKKKDEFDEDYEALELEGADDLDPLMVSSTRDQALGLRTSAAIEALERQRLRGEITSMIEAQPDAVASTLRGWLAESRT
ncbi:flagellar basal-body MS-ring/collar protein FliF [Modestobacter sp. Leaf380]|uniref:flagellar basal-body MS-ring/collar protein FliF n=1 Tax=Modestobacter sp. Leaf380 TaxID=1736356 RepID=UPI0006F8A886|nr:flagellar basal-body MS-ring/collar protein FliF [Modestobacter sp. Leaf380]KQS68388.1 flagellar M-ring protein FliF [Modestobacter sp. Leaf380]